MRARQDTVTNALAWPQYGCGVGLRTQHYDALAQDWPAMDFFEAVSENFMDTHGKPLRMLEAVRDRYPVALHGVSLSIGSADPLNKRYLRSLKTLVDHIDPFIVSDHLCWTGVGGENLHDLLPLPYTPESLDHVVGRVKTVQDCLGRRILLENPSSYITYGHSTLSEWHFFAELLERADCGMLLDVNNLYVNANNHGFDASTYLNALPPQRIGQIHIGGHTDMGDYLFDTHSAPAVAPVWDLYRRALERFGPLSTLIEWDEDIPAFDILANEAAKAREIMRHTVAEEVRR